MGSGSVVPNADITTEWLNTGGTHESCIDEGLPPILTDMISCQGSSNNGAIDSFNMGTLDVDGGTITSIEVRVYHETWTPICACVPFNIDINFGGWQGSKNYTTNESLGWESKTWAGLTGNQGDLDGLQVKITAGNLQTSSNCVTVHDTIWLYTLIVVITWSPPAGYGHKVLGVLPANIGKVLGVLRVNVGKVIGK